MRVGNPFSLSRYQKRSPPIEGGVFYRVIDQRNGACIQQIGGPAVVIGRIDAAGLRLRGEADRYPREIARTRRGKIPSNSSKTAPFGGNGACSKTPSNPPGDLKSTQPSLFERRHLYNISLPCFPTAPPTLQPPRLARQHGDGPRGGPGQPGQHEVDNASKLVRKSGTWVDNVGRSPFAASPHRPFLRNSEHIALFDRGGLLSSPWGAIDDGEHFVSASSRIAAHGVVVHRDHERSVPYLAL